MTDKDENSFDFDQFEVSPLRLAAQQLHEMYSELRKAGFSRSEALKLVSDAMSAGISGNNE